MSLHGLACSLLVALGASCAEEPTGPGNERLFVIEASELGPSLQTIGIFEGEQPVTGAEVTVNGVSIGHAGDGIYQGDLPVPLPAGAALELEALIGREIVTGAGTVPERLFLLEPTGRSAFALGETIPVRWGGAFADHVEVVATWVVGDTERSVSFPAPGDASTLEVPAHELPRGIDMAITVRPYNDGTLSGPIDPESRMRIRGADSDAPVIHVGSPLLVQGVTLGSKSQQVVIRYEGEPVPDAEVAINGVALTPVGDGTYQGELVAALPVGAKLELEARLGATTVLGAGTVPEVPVLTSPAPGTTFEPADPVTIAWTSDTTPDRFRVVATWTEGGSLISKAFDVLTEERSLQIFANQLAPGADVTIEVIAYDDGFFAGSADAGSRMGIASKSEAVITINP